MLLFIAVLVILLVLWVIKGSRKPANFPPGPPRVPLLGSVPYLKDKVKPPCIFHSFMNLKKDYGTIVGFYIGNNPTVLVSDYEVVKELFKKEELSYRPSLSPHNEHRVGWREFAVAFPDAGTGLQPGPIFSAGKYQQEMRRFILRHLKDFGFGKSSMEDTLNDQVDLLCKTYSKLSANGRPIEPNLTINVPVVNSIWGIITGETLDPEDPKSMELAELVDALLQSSNPQNALAQMLPHPSMGKWPILRHFTAFDFAQKQFRKMHDFVEPYIKEHQRTFDQDNIRDFIDVWLLEVQRTTDPRSCFYGQLGIDGLIATAVDFFLAGMDTTSNTLYWGLLYMLHHPEYKKRVYEEIDMAIGSDRMPSLDDRDSMPFVNACILEIYRASSIAFACLPHYTISDVPCKGYVIPKGTTVLAGLYNILNDPKHFKNPEVFNPLRFIDDMGRCQPDERVIAFSIGKRYCMGQSLAEKEVFLFFTGLMQQFDFQPAKGYPLPPYGSDVNHPIALIRSCPVFKTVVKKRN